MYLDRSARFQRGRQMVRRKQIIVSRNRLAMNMNFNVNTDTSIVPTDAKMSSRASDKVGDEVFAIKFSDQCKLVAVKAFLELTIVFAVQGLPPRRLWVSMITLSSSFRLVLRSLWTNSLFTNALKTFAKTSTWQGEMLWYVLFRRRRTPRIVQHRLY